MRKRWVIQSEKDGHTAGSFSNSVLQAGESMSLTAGFVEFLKRFMEFVFLMRQKGAPSDDKEEQSCSMACTIDDARL